MTRKQEQMVNKIKAYIEDNDMYRNSERYEFKEFSVEEMDYGTVSVYSVTGLKDDEGTAASILCRNYCHIFIGPRGGVHTYKHRRSKGDTTLYGFNEVMIKGCRH